MTMQVEERGPERITHDRRQAIVVLFGSAAIAAFASAAFGWGQIKFLNEATSLGHWWLAIPFAVVMLVAAVAVARHSYHQRASFIAGISALSLTCYAMF